MSVRFGSRRLAYAAALRELEGPGLGGVVLFVGRVRPDRGPTGRVVGLEYEAHLPLAQRALEDLERTARRRFGVRRVVLWHRTGLVPVDEASVLVGAAAPHRADAFEAARFLIEELKAKAPIWKTDRARSARQPRRRPRGSAGRSAG